MHCTDHFSPLLHPDPLGSEQIPRSPNIPYERDSADLFDGLTKYDGTELLHLYVYLSEAVDALYMQCIQRG